VLVTSQRKLALVSVLAGLLMLGAGDIGEAAAPRVAADVPLLNLSPAKTTPGQTGATEADLYMPVGKAMAKVVLYIPAGYGNVLGRPTGTQVGNYAVLEPPSVIFFGRFYAEDPAAYTNDPCAPGLHQSVWLLTLDIEPGDLPPTPVFVDATTSDTALGGYKAQFCIPGSSAKKIRELDLDILKLTNPATAGAYSWRAFVTPYKNSAPDDAGTFELRGTIPMPMTLTLHARYDRRHKRAILSGRLTAAGYDVTGDYLDLYANSRYVGSTRVNRQGFYSIKRRMKKTTRFRLWTATWDDCAPGSVAPAGCLSDSLANVSSRVVKVAVPKR
jgi:hypothetical protein